MSQGCSKRRYDEIGALLALASTKRARKGHRVERRKYFCSTCKAWHLTKNK